MDKTASQIATIVLEKLAKEKHKAGDKGSGTLGGNTTQFHAFKPEKLFSLKGKDTVLILNTGVGKGSEHLKNIGIYQRGKDQKIQYDSPMGEMTLEPNFMGSPKYTEVIGMHVYPEHRKKGYARQMMDAVKQLMPTQHFVATPDPFKDRAVSRDKLRTIYKSFGFQHVPTESNDNLFVTPLTHSKYLQLTQTPHG